MGVIGRGVVPSGASTGTKEALELRDGDKSFYLGKSVLTAVSNIKEKIQPLLVGKSVFEQQACDLAMLEADGTEFSPNRANALIGSEYGNLSSSSSGKGKSVYRYLCDDLKYQVNLKNELPAPLMNIINGGEHASNNLISKNL